MLMSSADRTPLFRGVTTSSLSLRRHAHITLAKLLIHMAHISGNTSRVSKSSSDLLNYTRTFFNVPPGNKDSDAKRPNKRRRRVYNCDDERLSAWTKCWIFLKYVKYLRHRIFKIHPRDLHTGLLLWRHLANESYSRQSEGLATWWQIDRFT